MCDICPEIYYTIAEYLTNEDIINLMSTCKNSRELFWNIIDVDDDLRIVKYLQNESRIFNDDDIEKAIKQYKGSYHEPIYIAINIGKTYYARKLYRLCSKNLSFLSYVIDDIIILEDLLERNKCALKLIRKPRDDNCEFLINAYNAVIRNKKDIAKLMRSYMSDEYKLLIMSCDENINHQELCENMRSLNSHDMLCTLEIIKGCIYHICCNSNYRIIDKVLEILFEKFGNDLTEEEIIDILSRGLFLSAKENKDYSAPYYIISILHTSYYEVFKKTMVQTFKICQKSRSFGCLGQMFQALFDQSLGFIVEEFTVGR